MTNTREILLERLEIDLLGPNAANELIEERPTSKYLTGILFPQETTFSPGEDEAIFGENGNGEDEPEQDERIELIRTFKPSTCGFSFLIVSEDREPRLSIDVEYGRYEPEETDENGRVRTWRRRLIAVRDLDIRVSDGADRSTVAEGLSLHTVSRSVREGTMVTLQFVNEHYEPDAASATDDRPVELAVSDLVGRERASFFQFTAVARCRDGTRFAPRPPRYVGRDDDAKTSDLIYRDAREYAVGHTCSVRWTPHQAPREIGTTWLPRAVVNGMNDQGDPTLREHIEATSLGRLHALELSHATEADLLEALDAIADGYAAWIGARRAELGHLPDDLTDQAEVNLARCDAALGRIHEGTELLRDDPVALRAFRLANRSMYIQAAWQKGFRDAATHDDPSAFNFEWRPFQMAFALLSLASTANRAHPDRDVFDLIWFPTGGGKTEAYLLLTAFSLFHRRLVSSTRGEGVGVLMRYTLRTLTVQQFQRAAALVTACEYVRRAELQAAAPFSIGLWVGQGSTPNTFKQAQEALNRGGEPSSTPRQIIRCPVCGGSVVWKALERGTRVVCECEDETCRAERPQGLIPASTVDSDIYQDPPSVLIGTVDKFAQIVRNEKTGRLFGAHATSEPPDLVIQDELHLIAGPLGSLVGLYETAIDALCSTSAGRAKIVGSTATIRQSSEQVRQVFDRRSFQFPPPAIDAANSCFAQTRNDDGRLYVGITTAGRSEKFALQFAAASLLQGVKSGDVRGREDLDAYDTLVAYFNSLKVLGGALVLMEDDVGATIGALQRDGEELREVKTPEELTSRKASSEIPSIMERLERPSADPEGIDVLLASNMLSVGVDIPRLGLMLMNGQPKYVSEYIQATSRVGRRRPGLVVTVYNANKIRDRAYFETFPTWHGALYRAVEPATTTPFAPRARDKGLHAPLVALARHVVGVDRPAATEAQFVAIEAEIERIVERIRRIDPNEADQAREELAEFVRRWRSEGTGAGSYWNDQKPDRSFLISAEVAARRRALGQDAAPGIPTPNSMRNVEATTHFKLWEGMPNEGTG
ncbi:DNA helicase [Jannaschia sp. Os4]|uniref:helicase-related protein n=1 Tax=Jannaschia sp. Os4 TaxID=2807617 RepID=UPI00193A3C78|nr:helicase-related protein [Jannaschia sp. Os4]MBM2575364.1 DNA helicase [Jannaschia sp. Os4]